MEPDVGDLAVAYKAHDMVVKSLARHTHDWKLCWFGCSCLWNISRSENTRSEFNPSIVNVLFDVLVHHGNKEQVVNTVIGTFSNLSLEHKFKIILGSRNALNPILNAARNHINNPTTASTAAGLIANLAVSDDIAILLMNLDIMQLLSTMLYINPSTHLLERNVASALNNCVTCHSFRRKFLCSRLIEPFITVRDSSSDLSTIALAVNCLMVVGVGQNEITTTCHVLSKHGELGILKRIVNEQLPLNMKDSNGMTMLDLAICSGELDVIKFLVLCGADVDACSTTGSVRDAIISSQDLVRQQKCRKAAYMQRELLVKVPTALCALTVDFLPVFELMMN